MLETQALWIGPWTSAAQPEYDPQVRGEAAGPTRLIRAAASDAFLGFARERAAASGAWWRWWLPRMVEVLENEDASLLFTVQHSWGWPRRWEVRDADARLVGSLRPGPFSWSPEVVRLWHLGTPPGRGKPRYPGTLVEDWYGRILAWIEDPAVRAPARLIAPDGQVMGTMARVGPATVVEFEATLDGKPFTKMALLAALLGCEQIPQRPTPV
jgi:hypothetical protein